jgi:hypothetical protein
LPVRAFVAAGAAATPTVIGETAELLKTGGKDDASRDLRSDRPVFKPRGIDKIPVFFKICGRSAMERRFFGAPLWTGDFPELPNEPFSYLAGIIEVLTPDILRARLNSLPIATTSDIDPTVQVSQTYNYAARHLAITSV